MAVEILDPETIYFAQTSLSLLGLLLIGALSQKQKEALLERDQHKCQFPFPHKCDWNYSGPRHRHAHHIIPQGYLARFGTDPDTPYNTIYICRNSHDIIHPDAKDARIKFVKEKNKDAFKEMQHKRSKILDNHSHYWETGPQVALTARALQLTQEALLKGWSWPQNGHQKDVSDSYVLPESEEEVED